VLVSSTDPITHRFARTSFVVRVGGPSVGVGSPSTVPRRVLADRRRHDVERKFLAGHLGEVRSLQAGSGDPLG